DGIPLGSQSYYSWNGLNVNSAISAGNISRINVSQGAGSVDVASTSNLGGTVQFYSSDPTDKTGGKISQTFGSNNSFQTFIRLDSGVLNPTGTKFFVSYTRTDEDKWKGSGSDFLQQVNAKLVQPIGSNTTMTAFFDWADEEEATYADSSINIIRTLGTRVDYYYPNYGAAYRAAEGIFLPSYQRLADPLDASYYDGPSTDQNYLGGLQFDSTPTDRLHLTATFYGHGKTFNSYYTTPYVTSPSGAPLAEEDDQTFVQRFGAIADATYTIARNTINTGVWFENTKYDTDLIYYNEPILGEGTPVNPFDKTEAPFAEPWGLGYNTNTFEYHLQDTYKPLSGVTINFGFKSEIVTGRSSVTANDVVYTGDTDRPSGSLTASDAFLPQISANWRFLPHNELYVDISKNMQAFPQAGFGASSPWSVATSQDFKQIQQNFEPEQDWVYELGYRLTTREAIGLISLYHTDFMNRQQSISVGSPANLQTVLENVGTVEMNGVDASLTLIPLPRLAYTNEISYNKSIFQNDVTSAGVTYDLKGKQEPNFPSFMYKTSLSYTLGQVNAHLDALHEGTRFLSYDNDTSVSGYWLANAGMSYRFSNVSVLKNLTVSFNVYNLFNEKYISNMGENGNPLSGDYNSMQIGAPRQFFGTIAAAF
ncbi:MAG: TonB-dependent receptor domain-containing protein, partial [Janthinobacterium lividum]